MANATNTAAEDVKGLIGGALLVSEGLGEACPICGALVAGYMAAKESAKAGHQRYSTQYPGAFCDNANLAPSGIYQSSNPMEWVGILHNYTVNEYHRLNPETNTRNTTLIAYAEDRFSYFQSVAANLSGVPTEAQEWIRDSLEVFQEHVATINDDLNGLMAMDFEEFLDTAIARFDRIGYSDVSDYLASFRDNTELQQAAEEWDKDTFNYEIAQEISAVISSSFATNQKNIILSILSVYKYSFNYWVQLQAPEE